VLLTNRHYKAEKLLKVALNTIKPNQQSFGGDFIYKKNTLFKPI
jgi:hypothetical protein